MEQLKYKFMVGCILLSGFISSQINDSKVICKMDGFEFAYPRLSKDDKKILYQSNKSGKWQLLIMDINKNSHTNITNDTVNNNFPDWSPDNSLISYVSDRDGNEEIYLMNAKDGSSKNISQDKGRDIHPYFSPDGKYLLFNSDRGNGSLDIYRYEIETGNILRLTNTMDDETCARYSIDMKSIVYLRNGISGDDVYLLNTSNFLSENITKTPKTRDGWPMFSFDGRWIYYSSMETGIYNIFKIKSDGSEKKQITNALPGEEDARVYVSHNNKYIIYNKRKGKTIGILSLPIN